jgi:hypothetical protein
MLFVMICVNIVAITPTVTADNKEFKRSISKDLIASSLCNRILRKTIVAVKTIIIKINTHKPITVESFFFLFAMCFLFIVYLLDDKIKAAKYPYFAALAAVKTALLTVVRLGE